MNDKSGRREFIISVFLRSGSVSDPEKFYHLEFVCDSEGEADALVRAAAEFGISAGVMLRKERFVVYLKEGDSISAMLAVLGAHNALLKFENIRVLKEMKDNVQRRVNFETANIRKTVSASVKQLEDIEYIRKRKKFSELPEGLKEVAELRIRYPEASLSELASMMPGLGRSGVNHRLRKIAGLAEKLKKEDSE